MDIDGYTTVGFRIRRTDCTQHSNDVGLFLLNKIYNRTAHGTNESEISDIDRYNHQADRSVETDAVGCKGTESEC